MKLLWCCIAVSLCLAEMVNGQTLLLDTFASDANLNSSLWSASAPILSTLASNYGSARINPVLKFGPAGMQMSGVAAKNVFTGIASRQTFAPPFTLTVTATGEIAHGLPFEAFLVSSNLSSRLSFSGNLNSANDPYYGMWLNYTGSGTSFLLEGSKFFAAPSTNSPYTFQLSVSSGDLFISTPLPRGGPRLRREKPF